MLFKDWAVKKNFEEEETTVEEIRDLLKLADEKIKDYEIVSKTEASKDLLHSTIYSAAIPCATAVVRASGYRISKRADGGHELLFQSLSFTLDPHDKLGRALQEARLLRNRTAYEATADIKPDEIEKLVDVVRKLRVELQKWLEKHDPKLLGS